MYKDPDRQREASAGRQRRYKAKQKALLSNIPKKVLLNREKALLSEGVTDKALPVGYKTVAELAPSEYNRVSKPGDPDYNGIGTVQE